MDKKTKGDDAIAPKWEDIEKRVIDSLDADNVGINYGIERWRDYVEKIRGVVDPGEVVYRITSPKVLDVVVEFFKADILENVAIFDMKIAKNKRRLAQSKIVDALGKQQGVFVDEELGEKVVPELLAVVRISEEKMQKKAIQAAMTMAENNTDKNAEKPSWPAGISEDFKNDLTEFIAANGGEGCQMIKQICQDPDFAKTVSNNEKMPPCIRYLAQIVVKTRTNNRLPMEKQKIGFGFGGVQNGDENGE